MALGCVVLVVVFVLVDFVVLVVVFVVDFVVLVHALVEVEKFGD